MTYYSDRPSFGICERAVGMSLAGIIPLSIVAILFCLVLPIVFCCLKVKGRAKRPTVDCSMHTNPSDAVVVSTAGPFTQNMTQQPSYIN